MSWGPRALRHICLDFTRCQQCPRTARAIRICRWWHLTPCADGVPVHRRANRTLALHALPLPGSVASARCLGVLQTAACPFTHILARLVPPQAPERLQMATAEAQPGNQGPLPARLLKETPAASHRPMACRAPLTTARCALAALSPPTCLPAGPKTAAFHHLHHALRTTAPVMKRGSLPASSPAGCPYELI